MEDCLFWLLVQNQKEWAVQFERQRKIRKDIIRTITRKYRSKGQNTTDEIRKNFENSFYADEITIIDNVDGSFAVKYGEEIFNV